MADDTDKEGRRHQSCSHGVCHDQSCPSNAGEPKCLESSHHEGGRAENERRRSVSEKRETCCKAGKGTRSAGLPAGRPYQREQAKVEKTLRELHRQQPRRVGSVGPGGFATRDHEQKGKHDSRGNHRIEHNGYQGEQGQRRQEIEVRSGTGVHDWNLLMGHLGEASDHGWHERVVPAPLPSVQRIGEGMSAGNGFRARDIAAEIGAGRPSEIRRRPHALSGRRHAGEPDDNRSQNANGYATSHVTSSSSAGGFVHEFRDTPGVRELRALPRSHTYS